MKGWDKKTPPLQLEDSAYIVPYYKKACTEIIVCN